MEHIGSKDLGDDPRFVDDEKRHGPRTESMIWRIKLKKRVV